MKGKTCERKVGLATRREETEVKEENRISRKGEKIRKQHDKRMKYKK